MTSSYWKLEKYKVLNYSRFVEVLGFRQHFIFDSGMGWVRPDGAGLGRRKKPAY